MTNEEKAIELFTSKIGDLNVPDFNFNREFKIKIAIVAMAEWKDREFAKQKQVLIDKACDAYCKVCGHFPHTVPKHICRMDCQYYSSFRKSMKETE